MSKIGGIWLVCCICGIYLLLAGQAHAQLTVVQGSAMNMTPQQLVQNYLVGAGITVSNVTFNGTSNNITSDQVGTFVAAGIAKTQLGLAGGILMTSGKASIAIGPNSLPGAGSQVGGPGDPDLNTLSGSNTADKAVIEFDFIPQFDTVRFRYVFGSEEFFEYCNQFNDAFGFFLSGPGITGTFSNNSVNIARMPGSLNNYVTINNICANTLSRWSNAGGQYFQYDGLTYVYTAWYVVQPCTTYHIKLAIGDAVDKAFDSGVFLEQNSFSSPGVNMINNSTIPQLWNKAVEGCNDVAVNFRLMATLSYPYSIHYTIGGTAVNGLDYAHIDDYVTFPPGEDSVNVVIHPIPDTTPEGEKTVILTLNQISCDGTIKRDTVYIEDYSPMTIAPNPDTAMCFGGSIELKANTTGGIMPLTYLWNIAGNDSTVIITPPVGNNTYTVRVTDVCTHSVSDSAIVLVHPVPVANAGSNVTIANGTSTTLHGTAGGGYGTYAYSWTSNPPGFTSTLPEPSTGNMDHTIIYILTVTDLLSGCQSPPSQVIVAVEGGALSVNPVAQPGSVCLGDTARLFALSGGGSGSYTYQWSSTPAGFTSGSANPSVIPTETTTYNLVVNDGFNQLSGSTNVVVYPLPNINLGPTDSLVCIYDTVTLDAGNQGSVYKWSTGSTNRYLTTATTGIGYDVQTYSVVVINGNGCKNTATINLVFTYDNCVGIDEHSPNTTFAVYPNPAHGTFRLLIRKSGERVTIDLMDMVGRKFLGKCFPGTYNPPDEHEIDISTLAPGIYVLHVRSEKFAGSVKLVIQ
ncbi:MAG: choice-of-anchor L domain-containing protein [Bacteroidetes bacterium]|nr:choice-of-anchor L domain-containing protein [Bacteroidota bacterium]